MTSYVPPNPWYNGIIYNPAFFTANTDTITIAYANATYLRRIGNPTSIATLTTFTGSVSIQGTSTFGNTLTMNSATLGNRIIRNIDYQLQDLATGNVGGQIYLNGTNLNILNNVNSGAINLYTKDGSGASTIPLKITSSAITTTERLTMSGTTDLDRIINNVYYQFQDKNALATTTGQIYASSGSMIYDNNAYSGIHSFAVDDAVGNQVIPLSLNSAGLQVGTGLTLNMGTGNITNATAISATTFNGALNGNASTATTATNSNITLTNLGSNQVVPLINTVVAVAGSYSLSMATAYPQNLLFNNSTGSLTCQSITSTLTGTATSIKDGGEGQLLYQSAPSITTSLPILGTNTYILTSNGSVPLWSPPVVPTLANVLIAGNSAGATDINMNSQSITNPSDITFANEVKIPSSTNLANINMGYNNLVSSFATKGQIAIGSGIMSVGVMTAVSEQNIGMGLEALKSITSGRANISIGGISTIAVSSGSNNTIVGHQATQSLTGSNNTVVGYQAGTRIQATANNVLMGTNSNVALTTSSGAVSIGANANAGTNGIAIGNGAGSTASTAGSIIINASGTTTVPNQVGCFIRPLRGVALGIGIGRVYYDSATFELQYSTT